MSKLYTLADCAAAAGISSATLARRIRAGIGPRVEKLGHRSHVVTADAFNAFVRQERG